MRRIEKPWGYEILWALTEHYAGKVLHINRGESLSLQFHERKDEALYIFRGALTLEIEEHGKMVRRKMTGGHSVRIPPGKKHRLNALTPCTVFEVSTPELSDVVRLEDRYGRA